MPTQPPDPKTKLRELFDEDCKKLLRGDAKKKVDDGTLTLSHLWRLSGWTEAGKVNPNSDPDLKDLEMDEIKSIADAFAKRLADAKFPGFTYTGTYACCCCTT